MIDVRAIENRYLLGVHDLRANHTLVLCKIEAHQYFLLWVVASRGIQKVVFVFNDFVSQFCYLILKLTNVVDIILTASAPIMEASNFFERLHKEIDDILLANVAHLNPIMVDIHHPH